MKTILVDAWNTLFTEEGMFEDMYQLLEDYQNTKVVVTNANDDQIVQFGIDKSPYDVFSLKNNPNKDEPIYFEKLLGEYNLKAEDVIYFEHNTDAVKSAQSLGIASYHYNHVEKNLVALKQFLDNNIY